MEEYLQCPQCWRHYNEDNVVGKTTAIKEGIKSTYEVVHCSCGKIFRGRKVDEKQLPRRH
jgi:uncharacterized C2H2 Zn-finger protein